MQNRGGSLSCAWVVGALVAVASVGCAQATPKPPNTLIVAASIGDRDEEATTRAELAEPPVGLSAVALEPAPVYEAVANLPPGPNVASTPSPTPRLENWWRPVWRNR